MSKIVEQVSAQLGKLRFDRPAKNFNEAIPIGNGHQGGMVYGQFPTERFSFNEDTVWAGVKSPEPITSGPETIEQARILMLSRNETDAEKLISENFLTAFNQPFLPAGELQISWPEDLNARDYCRGLDIKSATAHVSATSDYGDVDVKYFASNPNRVLAIEIARSGGPRECEIVLKLRSKLAYVVETSGRELILRGKVPSKVRWNGVDDLATRDNFVEYKEFNHNEFKCVARVVSDGAVLGGDQEIRVKNFRKITILLAVRSNRMEQNPLEACLADVDAAERNLNSLHVTHVQDFSRLFDAVKLELGEETQTAVLPEGEALNLSAKLAKSAFDFGRYLLISSSRPGTQPANLKGVWNEDIDPAWWSNYTLNINTQMNYWHAEMCGLAECHEPLFDFIEDLAKAGEKTAAVQYGLSGWVAHHQTDFHRQTTPVGALPQGPIDNCLKWAFWPFGGAWLALHHFEHFQYSNDLNFLRDRAYPVLSGAARFVADWLVVDPNDGKKITTIPSTSPENTFLREDGTVGSLSIGSAMDLAITRQLFANTIEAAEILGESQTSFVQMLKTKLSNLADYKFSQDGRILEFESDYPEAEHPHRHISPVFGLCPGTDVTFETNPDLCNAMRKFLDARGSTGTGWSLVWKARSYARLLDGKKSFEFMNRLFEPVPSNFFEAADDGGGIYPNMLMACPPFCIEANMGFVASIVELFVQDNANYVHLLPALPAHWGTGTLYGVRLRKGMVLDLEWRNGQLTLAKIKSRVHQKIQVKYQDKLCELIVAPDKICDAKTVFETQTLELN